MNLKLWCAALAFATAATVATAALDGWIASREIVGEAESTQVVSVPLDDAVFALAQDVLADVRVLDAGGRLAGSVTTYDLSKAVLRPERARSVADVMTRRVITTVPDEPVDIAAQKLRRNNISALPVVDADRRVVGMLTANNLSRLIGRGRE